MSGAEKINFLGEERRTPGLITGCFGGNVGKRGYRDIFKRYKKEKDPTKVIEKKPMGSVTKFVFETGRVEYAIYDSQVGTTELSHIQGVNIEKDFDDRQKELAKVAFNTLP